MHRLLTPAEIEAAAARAGLRMAEVCRRAGIAPSTFSRWKSGQTMPSIDVYERLVAAACVERPAA